MESTKKAEGQVSSLAEGPKDRAELTTGIETLDEQLDSGSQPDFENEPPERDKIVDEVVEILRGCGPGFLSGLLVGLRSRKGVDMPEAIQEDRQEQGTEAVTGTITTKVNLKERRVKEGLSNVRRAIEGIINSDQREILEAALEEVNKVSDSASRLNNMRDRVCKIYDRLDLKAKAAITALQELAAVEGCSVGVDYGNELLYVTGRDQGCIEQAKTELPDDEDVKVLAEVFELSSFINKAV